MCVINVRHLRVRKFHIYEVSHRLGGRWRVGQHLSLEMHQPHMALALSLNCMGYSGQVLNLSDSFVTES